jgi:hypothetical protein
MSLIGNRQAREVFFCHRRVTDTRQLQSSIASPGWQKKISRPRDARKVDLVPEERNGLICRPDEWRREHNSYLWPVHLLAKLFKGPDQGKRLAKELPVFLDQPPETLHFDF